MKITKRKIKYLYPGFIPFRSFFCYGCGRSLHIDEGEEYFLFNGRVFCDLNCIEDHVKHFYERAALICPWIMDEPVYENFINIKRCELERVRSRLKQKLPKIVKEAKAKIDVST